MGYYTDYYVEVHGPNQLTIDDASNDLMGISGYTWQEPLGPMGAGILANEGHLDGAKWYSRQDDVISVSKDHPNCLFVITGQGEDPSDKWMCWVKDGVYHHCEAEITYKQPDWLDGEMKKLRELQG